MIRINLLPDAKRASGATGSGQLWGVIYLLACFAWGLVLFVFYLNEANVLDEQLGRNAELKAQIGREQGKSANLAEVEGKLAHSRQLEEVVAKLQAARQGPTRLLMELGRVLSAGRGPTVNPDVLDQMRRENPLAGYNPGWDIRRLWLTSFEERSGSCKIKGMGKTNEDVAEFLRRLSLSEIFEDVMLVSTTSTKDQETSLPIVSFDLTCSVRY